MKKNKLSVIFFLLCFISFIIYKKFNYLDTKYLYIGDSSTYYKHFSKYDNYIFDSISYDEIHKRITNNDFKIIKDKNVHLNQLISNSDVIILNANNFDYENKCKKNKRIISEYDNLIYKKLDNLVNLINRISSAKIYVIGNYCSNGKYIQKYKSDKYTYISYENVENIDKIVRKTMYN